MPKTMTVKELRDFLLLYPEEFDNLPVLATWEGVYAAIISENVVVEVPYRDDWTQEAFIIDVEENF